MTPRAAAVADPLVEPGSAARLRTIICVDIATVLAATLFMLVVYGVAVRSGYLLLAAALVACSGGVMAAGLAPLRRGDVPGALRWLAVANWGIAIAAATVATFSWPLMMLAAMLPCIAAATLISGRELALYVAASATVSLGVVLVGVLQDVSGLSDEVPDELRDAVLIVFAPTLVGILALLVHHNSATMQRALAELRRSRARVVAATDRERRRIERDLHDGAQQRLIGIGLALSRATELCASDPAKAARSLETLRHELRVAHEELRDLAQGVYPPVLTEHGLEAALQSAADRCPLPVTLAVGKVGRHRANVEAALYFSCVEALQNAAKHSRGSSVEIACGVEGPTLWITVADDGVGVDHPIESPGRGIVNLTDRLGSIGGGLDLLPRPGGGTIVRAFAPVAPVGPVRPADG